MILIMYWESWVDYTGSNPSRGPIHDIGDFQKRRQEIDDRNKNIS